MPTHCTNSSKKISQSIIKPKMIFLLLCILISCVWYSCNLLIFTFSEILHPVLFCLFLPLTSALGFSPVSSWVHCYLPLCYIGKHGNKPYWSLLLWFRISILPLIQIPANTQAVLPNLVLSHGFWECGRRLTAAP